MIAETLGITQPAISRRMRGLTEWAPSELVVLATLLNLDPGDLFAYYAEPAAS